MRASPLHFGAVAAALLLACGSSVETTSTGGAGGTAGSTTTSSSSGMGGASSSSSSSSNGVGGGQTCYQCACTDCSGGTKNELGNTPCTSIPTSTCEGLDGGTDGGPVPYKECVQTGVIENCV